MSQIEILDCFDRAVPSRPAEDGAPRSDLTLSAADIIGRTQLPRSSVFRDLKSLIRSGFVYQDPVTKRYALGPRILQLGLTARRQLGSEDQVAVPLMELMRQTSESVTFSVVDVPWRTCVYMIEAPSELRHFVQVGTRYPLHLGAAGKVILAYLAPAVVATVLKSHGIGRSESVAITRQLEHIASRGSATTTAERVAGASSVAAPVFVGGSVYGSVAVAGPIDRFKPLIERHERMVLEAGRRLSERLSMHANGGAEGQSQRSRKATR